MGNSQIKDENIIIFLKTTKNFYLAGDTVHGLVHIRAAITSNYSNIIIGVHGQEYIHWQQGSYRRRRIYSSKYTSYDERFKIVDLNGTLNAGDFTYPFSFLLPSMMNGSYYRHNECYIKYNVRAVLTHPNDSKRSQIFQAPLNIIEPPRGGICPLANRKKVASKCCSCCCLNYGIVDATLSSDKNLVYNGGDINVVAKINNLEGLKDIENSSIVLFQKQHWITFGGSVKTKTLYEYTLKTFDKVLAGEVKQFKFCLKIPQIFSKPTAIGKVLAHYYILQLIPNYGFCANKPLPTIHLILHSKNPMIRTPQQYPPPPNWNPQKMPAVTFNKMKPFEYNPNQGMPFLNQAKSPLKSANVTKPTTVNNQNFMVNQNIRSPLNPNSKQNGEQKPSFKQVNTKNLDETEMSCKQIIGDQVIYQKL